MAYAPTTWKDGDVITADKLNNLEQGVTNEQVGPKGDPGDAGKDGAKGDPGTAGKDGATGPAGLSVKSIALTTDASGKITGGTATLSDDKTTVPVTVTQAAAEG